MGCISPIRFWIPSACLGRGPRSGNARGNLAGMHITVPITAQPLSQRSRAMPSRDWEVVIVGAGPAGLSAALILGRCRRRILLCDAGTPRSWAAHRMHGFLSRDGMDLNEFRATAHEQLSAYPNVRFFAAEVRSVKRASTRRFAVRLVDRTVHHGRKVLLASGVFDLLPKLPAIDQFFGTTVHPCPYCEG
jgi:thioredoxin reductase